MVVNSNHVGPSLSISRPRKYLQIANSNATGRCPPRAGASKFVDPDARSNVGASQPDMRGFGPVHRACGVRAAGNCGRHGGDLEWGQMLESCRGFGERALSRSDKMALNEPTL